MIANAISDADKKKVSSVGACSQKDETFFLSIARMRACRLPEGQDAIAYRKPWELAHKSLIFSGLMRRQPRCDCDGVAIERLGCGRSELPLILI